MSATAVGRGAVEAAARSLALDGFAPPGERRFGSHPAWAALRALGTALWLDTGDLDAARKLWTDDFSNLTTNNTLVNKEVQKGLFDDAVRQIGRSLRDADPSLSLDDLVIETGFVVNCRNALRLVEAFDATVSVELHPAMADDVARSVAYGRRYFAVNPERFIVKVPLTPAGFLAARQLALDGVPVNYTLGFSARQNVLAAAFSRPVFVNVFMGRLNSFVADNGLGDGENIGERATMETQKAILQGRESRGWSSRLIGASMRSAAQVWDLAGLDVFTMPTGAAEEFRTQYEKQPRAIESQVGRGFAVETSVPEIVDRLWTVDENIYRLGDKLAGHDVEGWNGSEFAAFAREHGVPDLFHEWSTEDLRQIRADGKIPKWERWRGLLESGRAGLDDLMTQAALNSFVTDQQALDSRLRKLLGEAGLT